MNATGGIISGFFGINFGEAFRDALFDSLNIIPFLFLIFLLIEVLERFYSDKILSFAKLTNGFKIKTGPLIGAILASIPQCGLSVIASAVYTRHLITRGTLIAVYIATSDEAIPVLLSNPGGAKAVFPLIMVKILTGVIAGYLVDTVFKGYKTREIEAGEELKIEKGCHSHSITKENEEENSKDPNLRNSGGFRKIMVLILHPFVHTLSVVFFVFSVTFIINILFSAGGGFFGNIGGGFFENNVLNPVKEFVQIILSALVGIIPNCAVSVGITVMYLKGLISFASCVAGLSAGAGLGILVLIKKNEDKKDTIFIISLLLILSILAGCICGCVKLFIGG